MVRDDASNMTVSSINGIERKKIGSLLQGRIWGARCFTLGRRRSGGGSPTDKELFGGVGLEDRRVETTQKGGQRGGKTGSIPKSQKVEKKIIIKAGLKENPASRSKKRPRSQKKNRK